MMRISIATILVGICAGLGGMSLALLLYLVQHFAFGVSDLTFLQDVQDASPQRRVYVLILCGLLAGLGWWLISRFGQKIISISEAVNNQKPMPVLTTIWHILLQIITIGMGSPLGREVAPREFGILIASWISQKTKLDPEETKVMLACGASAGLAAVYNVPLAGAVFALEVLLCRFSFALLLQSLIISGIAVLVSWIGLGNRPAYQVPNLEISYALVIWALITGPIFGYFGHYFFKLASLAKNKVQTNWQIPVFCLFNFTLLGLLAIYFPALLGNGKSPALLVFDNNIGLALAASLLFLRVLIVCFTLRSGARGGLLTPSLANGALLGVLLGGLWNLVWPGTELSAFGIVGATAFLAAAQSMPITAMFLIFEFTRISPSFLIPIVLAILGVKISAYYLNFSKAPC